MTLLLKSIGCCPKQRCAPCVEKPKPIATIVVDPDPVTCSLLPAEPQPMKLNAKPLAVGLWRITDPAGVAPDKQEFVASGTQLVQTDALRGLGVYIAETKALIAAQAACIKAMQAKPLEPRPQL